jgi:hypothetical protein
MKWCHDSRKYLRENSSCMNIAKVSRGWPAGIQGVPGSILCQVPNSVLFSVPLGKVCEMKVGHDGFLAYPFEFCMHSQSASQTCYYLWYISHVPACCPSYKRPASRCTLSIACDVSFFFHISDVSGVGSTLVLMWLAVTTLTQFYLLLYF